MSKKIDIINAEMHEREKAAQENSDSNTFENEEGGQ